MKTPKCGVYRLTHIATGRVYVGQSIDIDRRWREHANGKSGSGIIAHAIAKYGWAAFEAKTLELCSHDELNAAEQRWVSDLKATHPGGFNLTTGGGQFKFTDEARRIISERTKVFMTPEWIAKRSETQRGIPKSEEWKAKMSARQSQPDNISRIAAMANNQSAETREKIAASKRGKPMSPESRARVSASKTGKKTGPRTWVLTDEARAKMSASAKARCERQRLEHEVAKP